MSNISSDRVLICPHLGDGGSQRVIVTLANAWVRKGLKVTLITLYPEPDCYQIDSKVKRIYCHQNSLTFAVPGKKNAWQKSCILARTFLHSLLARLGLDCNLGIFLYYIRLSFTLRQAIHRSGSSLVIAFVGHVNVLTIIACIGLGKRVVISERNDPARQHLGTAWEVLRKRLYRYANIVTANSHNAMEVLSTYVPLDKLVFTPNPLTLPIQQENTAKLPPKPFILAVGRLHKQKAIDVLLDAFSQLPSNLNHWSLLIVGQGDEQASLKNLSENLGISDKVLWIGQVSDPFPYYQNAEFFVQPSRYEGMSNALLEAMACSLAPIVSDAASGSLELVKDGVSGLVVPVENPVALAHALTQLALEPDLTKHLGKQAHAKISPYLLPQALSQWEQALLC